MNTQTQVRETEAIDRINRAIVAWESKKKTKKREPKIRAIYGLYSGGHDSLASCYIASKHPLFKGVIHINTQTSPAAHLITLYARETAKALGWKFVEVSPFIKARMLFVEYGFPSPSAHEFYYQYLKGRPLKAVRDVVKSSLLDELTGEKTIEVASQLELDNEGSFTWINESKWTKKRRELSADTGIAYVGGRRRQESKVRSALPEWSIERNVLWVDNIVDWSLVQRDIYIDALELPRNKTADQTGISGECECGAHAKPGELDLKCKTVKGMALYRSKTEQLVRLARELQLMEVEFGMRAPDRVIDEHDTVWGHGRKTTTKTPTTPPEQMDMFRICGDCDFELNANGDMGVDPDLELMAARLRKSLKQESEAA